MRVLFSFEHYMVYSTLNFILSSMKFVLAGLAFIGNLPIDNMEADIIDLLKMPS